MYEIEFCIDNWIRERRDSLYHRRCNISQRRIQRIICTVTFFAAVIIGLFAVSCWPLAKFQYLFELDKYYDPSMLILMLCVAVCIVSLIGFLHSLCLLQIHLPGTKLDYDGPNIRESCRIRFEDGRFTLWRGGEKSIYKYSGIRQIYRDRRGLLLGELDLYIPLETIPGPSRRQIIQKFTQLYPWEKLLQKIYAHTGIPL